MNSITEQKVPSYKANALCTALRYCHPASHDDLLLLIAAFASMVMKSQVMTRDGTAVVVDMLDEATGQIEQDEIDQRETA